MAINLKAKETLIQVGELKGKYRFVLGTELYSKLSESKVIKEAALRSGVSRGVMQACWDAAGEVIKAWATEGHSVAIPGLGTMRFGVRAKSVETVTEVASGLITARRVIFTPNVDIKDELQRTAIQITCYDKDGNVIKKVRIELLTTKGLSKPDRVREIIKNHLGKITKSEIMAKCPDISQITVQRTLAELLKNGETTKLSGGRYTAYLWSGEE